MGGSQLFSKLFCILNCAFLAFSCDVLESDPDVIEPKTIITGEEIYVLANSPTIVDLNAKFQSNTPVRIALTSDARHGEISDLGKGLLQYSPSPGNSRGRDGFEFTVYTLDNEVVKRDSVVIIIETDSANLPCNIYPAPDYIYGVDRSPVVIDVLANDIICGGKPTISIFKPVETFPPYFGQAEIVDNKIEYTPNSSFDGADKIVYKISLGNDTARTAYGIVYVTGDSVCSFTLADDSFVTGEQVLDSLITLPVFQNDSLCDILSAYTVIIKSAPVYGQASTAPNAINYKVPSAVSFPFLDSFTYEVCIDATCKTARVDIEVKKDSLCVARAMADSFDISDYNTSLVYLDVLRNDSTCSGVSDLKIATAPRHGTAGIANKTITYKGSVTAQKNDSLRYEICSAGGCSSAVVYIKRAK